MFTQHFSQSCRNYLCKIWIFRETLQKSFYKISCNVSSFLMKKRAWNNSWNVSVNLPEHFVKCLCPLSKLYTKYFRKVSETFHVMIVWIFTQNFLQSVEKYFCNIVEILVQKVCDLDLNISRNFAEKFLQDFV